jgi:hypothetical protein
MMPRGKMTLADARAHRFEGFYAECALDVCQEALAKVIELVRQSQRAGLANVDTRELAQALEIE